MSEAKMSDLFVMGVERETYEELLDMAKKQGKTVNEVTSDALRSAIEQSKGLQESKSKKVLMEG
jgi:predicted HicB family RNase H-like nuclease